MYDVAVGERVDLSILVSTYNRARDLRRLLASLQNSTDLGARRWEVIVVDNNSTDDTARVVAEFQLTAPFPIRSLREPRQGKSYALNAGLAVAAGEVVAFTDDDIIVTPSWGAEIIRFLETHQDAACVGGMVKLYDPADAPVSTRTSPDPARVTIRNFPAGNIPIMGCNMALRASALRAVGPFDTDLGPGSRIGVADDLDLLYRIVQHGYPIDYVPEILVLHNHGRRERRSLDDLRLKYMTGRGGFYCKHILQGDRTVARWAYWECSGLLKFNGRGALFTPAARRRWQGLWFLVLGAIRYLRYREQGV